MPVSKDGVAWDKPELDVKKGTNIVQTSARDSSTVWLDLEEKDPEGATRCSARTAGRNGSRGAVGPLLGRRHPLERAPQPTGACGDRTTVFYNPFRKVWVYSLRHGWGRPRRRRYWETRDDVINGAAVGANRRAADVVRLRPTRPAAGRLQGHAGALQPRWRRLREPDARPVHHLARARSPSGREAERGLRRLQPRRLELDRPDRRGSCPVSENQGRLELGQRPVGGRRLPGGRRPVVLLLQRSAATGRVTALAVLRRDGFASMDAGDAEGALTTRPVSFRGKHLFVNVDTPAGELRAEVLDEKGEVMAPFTRPTACRSASTRRCSG